MNFLHLFENDFYAILPELFLITATTVLLVFGVIFSTSKDHGYPILIHTTAWLGVLTLFWTLCLLFNSPISFMVCFYNTLIIDEFTYLLKIMILLSASASILISLDYLKTETINVFEYIVLLLFSTCSMLLMVSSYDFISMYLSIEMQSLCFYVLAACKRNSEFSTESGLKYFLLGAFSSGILLFGCSLIYGFTGITNFEALAKFLSGFAQLEQNIQSTMLTLGILFLAVGFLFKLTAAPFHFWAPDVYEGAPTSVTAFFALTPKIAILGLFIRLFLFSFYDCLFSWQYLLIICSLLSLIVGSFGAMAQKKIKRLLVYSSVGHVGYLLMGVCCGTLEGIQGLLLYIIIYVVMTLNIFTVVLCLTEQNDMSRIKYIQDLGMISQTHPLLAISLSLTLFSMAGIPPLAGFCSKFYLFFAALGSSLYSLAIFGVLSSVISCFYYIRLIKIMYFEKPSKIVTYKQVDQEKASILALTTFFIVFFFLFPNSLFLFTYKIAFIFLG